MSVSAFCPGVAPPWLDGCCVITAPVSAAVGYVVNEAYFDWLERMKSMHHVHVCTSMIHTPHTGEDASETRKSSIQWHSNSWIPIELSDC